VKKNERKERVEEKERREGEGSRIECVMSLSSVIHVKGSGPHGPATRLLRSESEVGRKTGAVGRSRCNSAREAIE